MKKVLYILVIVLLSLFLAATAVKIFTLRKPQKRKPVETKEVDTTPYPPSVNWEDFEWTKNY